MCGCGYAQVRRKFTAVVAGKSKAYGNIRLPYGGANLQGHKFPGQLLPKSPSVCYTRRTRLIHYSSIDKAMFGQLTKIHVKTQVLGKDNLYSKVQIHFLIILLVKSATSTIEPPRVAVCLCRFCLKPLGLAQHNPPTASVVASEPPQMMEN